MPWQRQRVANMLALSIVRVIRATVATSPVQRTPVTRVIYGTAVHDVTVVRAVWHNLVGSP
jgi:hypothetical protein